MDSVVLNFKIDFTWIDATVQMTWNIPIIFHFLISELLPLQNVVRTSTGNPVIFSAYISSSRNFASGTIIKPYDGFNTNIGDSFNLGSGEFKAPVGGVYEFSFAITRSDGNLLRGIINCSSVIFICCQVR